MKTIGIITEYNPFHNGHAYQIQKAKELTGADNVIIIMSGNFVQRGTPAFADKYTRVRMALEGGADAVFELPVIYSTASAEYFALGAVRHLNACGIIDYLCFGAETSNPLLLNIITEVLTSEPDEFKSVLKTSLASGISFPLARNHAIKQYLLNCPFTGISDTDNTSSDCVITEEMIDEILTGSNNILAIEYLKALKKTDSRIVPLIIKREGAGYHSESFDECYTSASAIRRLLSIEAEPDYSKLECHMPAGCLSLIKQLSGHSLPVVTEDFSDMMFYSLLGKSETELKKYFDISDELARRMVNLFSSDCSFSPDLYTAKVKSRQYTHTRISRALIHVLLGISDVLVNTSVSDASSLYLRLLGFKKNSSVMGLLKKSTLCPVITKPAAATKQLEPAALLVFNKDIYASEIYNRAVFKKFGTIITDDFRHNPVIL